MIALRVLLFVGCAVAAFFAMLGAAAFLRGKVRDRQLTPVQRAALRVLEQERRAAVAALARDFPRLHPELVGEDLRKALGDELEQLERAFAQRALAIHGDTPR